MPSSRKDCLNLTKELNQYLAKKDSEIRKKLKDGPPSQGDHPIPPEPAPKSFVYHFQLCKYFIVLLHFKQVFLFSPPQLSFTKLPEHCKLNIGCNWNDAFVLAIAYDWACIRCHRPYNCKPIPIEFDHEPENLLLKVNNKIRTNPLNCFQREFISINFCFLQCLLFVVVVFSIFLTK